MEVIYPIRYILISLVVFFFTDGRPVIKSGTALAVVNVPGKIYLFSDGRVSDVSTGKVVSDSQSKVFKLTNSCVILTAGIKIQGLEDSLAFFFKKNNIVYVNNAIPYIREVVVKYAENREIIDILKNNHKIFLFVCGFDNLGHQRTYWLDSNSIEPFKIEEHISNYTSPKGKTPIDAGWIADKTDPTVFTNKIKSYSDNLDFHTKMDLYIRKSFDYALDIASHQNKNIGGRTFEYIITKDHCYGVN